MPPRSWAVGTVIAELLSFAPLFPGSNDIDQIFKVFQVLGTPTSENWPVSLKKRRKGSEGGSGLCMEYLVLHFAVEFC